MAVEVHSVPVPGGATITLMTVHRGVSGLDEQDLFRWGGNAWLQYRPRVAGHPGKGGAARHPGCLFPAGLAAQFAPG